MWLVDKLLERCTAKKEAPTPRGDEALRRALNGEPPVPPPLLLKLLAPVVALAAEEPPLRLLPLPWVAAVTGDEAPTRSALSAACCATCMPSGTKLLTSTSSSKSSADVRPGSADCVRC